MNSTSIAGVLLILAGMAALILGEASFAKQETAMQIADARIEAESKETAPLPPVAEGIAVAAGAALVVVGLRG